MNRNKSQKYTLIALAIVGSLYLLTNCRETEFAFIEKPNSIPNLVPKSNNTKNPEVEDLRQSAYRERGGSAPLDFKKSNPQILALHVMTNLLAQSLQPEVTMDRIVEILREHSQLPTITEDGNGVTGTMYVIRTQSPYNGTRYFHAQYFENSDKTKFVQHMSFEFRPGPTAMKEAVEAVKINFPGLGDPYDFNEDIVTWKLNNSYFLQVTKLSQEDIENGDPLNSYDAADVGTISVALIFNEHADDGHDNDDENGAESEDFAD